MRNRRKSGIFEGGIPAEPDVRKLMEAYPEDSLNLNMVIPYGDVEKIIGIKYGPGRWKTVTKRWRDDVKRDLGKIIGHEEEDLGVAFRVLNHPGKVRLGVRSERKIKTQVKRIREIVALVDRKALTDTECGTLDRLDWRSNSFAANLQLRGTPVVPQLTSGKG